jgi:carboxypeptidase Q
VEGAIGLILRGTCDFGQKAALAGAAGAVGALIYNWDVGGLPGRTLGPPENHPEGPYQPTVGISDTDGAELIALLEAGPVTADLTINTFDITVYNVIAQTTGGDQNNVLQIGAHSDSVEAGKSPVFPFPPHLGNMS